jgi:hypothetical protein
MTALRAVVAATAADGGGVDVAPEEIAAAARADEALRGLEVLRDDNARVSIILYAFMR